MTLDYAYPHETARRVMAEIGATIRDTDLEQEICDELDLPDAPDDRLLVFTAENLDEAARQIARHAVTRRQAQASRRAEASSQLLGHQRCHDVIEELLTERDSLIAAVRSAQMHCSNDLFLGEHGEHYVMLNAFLEALRPRIDPHHRWGTGIEETCSSCRGQWIHDDDCEELAEAEAIEERAEHEVKSHGRCSEITDELLAQIECQYTHIDSVAAHALRHASHEDGLGEVVDPRRVLTVLAMEQPCASVPCHTLTAAIRLPVEELDYCDDEAGDHVTPHRACRWLVQ